METANVWWWRYGALVVAVFASAAATQNSQAQDAPPKDERARPRGGFLFTPEQMLENAVRDTSFRYKLDADQKELTRQIFADHGRRFFEKHGEELQALQMEGMKLRFGGEEDPEHIKDLAKRFRSLFDAARKTLEEAGDDFHQILDEEQAAQHDTDRKNLRAGLDKVSGMIDQTIADGITPWARERLASGEALEDQRRRIRWTGGGIVERDWEAYTEGFIVHYKLDDQQSANARSMLDLARKDAAEYRKANESKIRDIVEAYRKIGDEERKADTTAARKAELKSLRKPLDADAGQLEKPLEAMFNDLREALDTLPTEQQKRKAGPFGPRRKDAKKP